MTLTTNVKVVAAWPVWARTGNVSVPTVRVPRQNCRGRERERDEQFKHRGPPGRLTDRLGGSGRSRARRNNANSILVRSRFAPYAYRSRANQMLDTRMAVAAACTVPRSWGCIGHDGCDSRLLHKLPLTLSGAARKLGS